MEWLRSIVRPTVTWAMVGMFGYGLLIGKIPWTAAEPVITVVIAFWFIERTIEKAKNKV